MLFRIILVFLLAVILYFIFGKKITKDKKSITESAEEIKNKTKELKHEVKEREESIVKELLEIEKIKKQTIYKD